MYLQIHKDVHIHFSNTNPQNYSFGTIFKNVFYIIKFSFKNI